MIFMRFVVFLNVLLVSLGVYGYAQAKDFPLRHLLVDAHIEKPVIFNVWATWCRPCVQEMPELEALAAEGDYHVYALSIDRHLKAAQDFWQKVAYKNIHFLHDPSGKAFFESYRGQGIPVTFILDKELNVKAVEQGIRSWHHSEMKEKIIQHLK